MELKKFKKCRRSQNAENIFLKMKIIGRKFHVELKIISDFEQQTFFRPKIILAKDGGDFSFR